MVNTDRIVPVTAIDLISLYGLILTQAGTAVTPVETENPGIFEVTTGGDLLAAEPVAEMNFVGGVSANVYFVAAYDFIGFTQDGTEVVITGDVEKDGRTLYKAEIAGTAATVSKIGF